MSTGVIIVICIVVVIWSVCIWEAINSPIMPDDYGIRWSTRNTQEAPPTNEKSPPSSQTYSGTTKPKNWTYATTDCLCQMKEVKVHTKDCTIKNKNRTLDELRQVKNFGYVLPSPSREKS